HDEHVPDPLVEQDLDGLARIAAGEHDDIRILACGRLRTARGILVAVLRVPLDVALVALPEGVPDCGGIRLCHGAEYAPPGKAQIRRPLDHRPFDYAGIMLLTSTVDAAHPIRKAIDDSTHRLRRRPRRRRADP